MLEMWPDLERVGQGTGRVCGNPRLNHECNWGHFKKSVDYVSLHQKKNQQYSICSLYDCKAYFYNFHCYLLTIFTL